MIYVCDLFFSGCETFPVLEQILVHQAFARCFCCFCCCGACMYLAEDLVHAGLAVEHYLVPGIFYVSDCSYAYHSINSIFLFLGLVDE